jgi:hypothetical protein
MSKYPEFAFTGPQPATGYVGYVNIRETDTGIQFTVRSEGSDPVTATFEMDIGSAIELLDKAFSNFANRP